MEIERDFEYYRARSPVLKQESQVIEDGLSTKVAYKIESSLDRFIQKTVASILKSIETITGPLYSFKSSAESTPLDLQKIEDYLRRENIIAEQGFLFDPPYNDEPKLSIVSLHNTPKQEAIDSEQIRPFISFGSSFHTEDAIAKAVGEFLERYFLLPLKTRHRFKKDSVANLQKNAVKLLNPRALASFSKEQKARDQSFNINEESEFLWVEGKNFPEERKIILPAQTVFWYYYPKNLKEPYIREPTTNGAAGMFTKESAILAGLEELIQRDGFLIFWLNTIPPPRIDQASIENAEIQEILSKIKRYRLKPTILDTTTDIGLPSFIAVICDGEGGNQSVAIGGGGEMIPERAIKRALEEALLVKHMQRRNKNFSLPDDYTPFGDNRVGHIERIQLWANPAMFSRFEWFLTGKQVSLKEREKIYKTPQKREGELMFLVNILESLGSEYKIYYYEARSKVLEKLGYHVVKVIVPALVHLYLYETFAPLDTKRLREVPGKLGYQKTVFPNPLPHPFP